jgi:hypothetical protein
MKRRVPQNIKEVSFNSAKLCEKFCETLRDMLFFILKLAPKEKGCKINL